jgi:hypothetical protein
MGRYNNTIVRAWGYKLLITLMWLAVPAATAYLARADYQRYTAEGAVQRADCEARADVLGRYTGLYARQAATVQQASDSFILEQWERELRDLERQHDVERRLLRSATPTHYPHTDAQLGLLEEQLADQLEQTTLAGTRQDQYLRAEDGLLAMSQAVAEVEAAAYYYERIGAEGIYLMLMEDLAKLEDRFRQLQQHRRQLNTECESALRDADALSRGIQRELKRLPDKLSQDEQTTYTEALYLRFERFNPWAELQASLRRSAP